MSHELIVRINKKGTLISVSIVAKMDTQMTLVAKYTGNPWIENQDSITIEIVVIKLLLTIKARNFKGKARFLVELSTHNKWNNSIKVIFQKP